MDIFQLKIEESGWYIAPCILLAAAYAYFLYREKEPFTNTVRYVLGSLRFLAVFLICFLLLSPYLNYTKNTYEKPVVAFLVDNSSSITMEQPTTYEKMIKKALKTSSSTLLENEIEAVFYDLNKEKELDSIRFDYDETNVSTSLKNIQDNFFNQNLAAIVLVSDGIVNRGSSPEYLTLTSPVYSLGLGDTTLKKDLAIEEIKVNKTAYINNSFPIKATIHHQGYLGKKIKVSLSKKDSVISERELVLSHNPYQEITFYSSEKKPKIAAYSIKVTQFEDETTHKNNIKKVYIEIVDNKEKIILYATAPHPDIKTIRTIINRLDRYDFEVYIEGISKTEINPDNYHLIIGYQIPSVDKKGKMTEKIRTSNTPKLYIVGNQTDIREFSNTNKTLIINGNNNQRDEVNAYLKTDFNKFQTDQSYLNELLPIVPPISVPFADYLIKGITSNLLNQQVGSIKTDKPLLLLQNTNGFKEGVLIGDGYWRWALFEFAEKQQHKLLDELLSKTIQFLVTKDDKRKLVVSPDKQDFYTSETVRLNIKTLNAIYEPISGTPVLVTISNEKGEKEQYSYQSDAFQQSFPVRRLEESNYTFVATASIDNKLHTATGAFTVKEKQLEELDLQANHLLLKKIAKNNAGNFYTFDKHRDLVDELVSQNFKKVIHSQETNRQLRETWWYVCIIVALFTAEWILRKVKGSRI